MKSKLHYQNECERLEAENDQLKAQRKEALDFAQKQVKENTRMAEDERLWRAQRWYDDWVDNNWQPLPKFNKNGGAE